MCLVLKLCCLLFQVMVKGLDEDAALHGSKAPVSPAHPPFDNRGTPGVKTVGSQMSVGVVVQGEASAVEDTTELELPTR